MRTPRTPHPVATAIIGAGVAACIAVAAYAAFIDNPCRAMTPCADHD